MKEHPAGKLDQERVTQLRLALSSSRTPQALVAESAGVGRSYTSLVINGKRGITPSLAYALYSALSHTGKVGFLTDYFSLSDPPALARPPPSQALSESTLWENLYTLRAEDLKKAYESLSSAHEKGAFLGDLEHIVKKYSK